MTPHGSVGLYSAVVGLGLLHGLEPGHGWPVAASWALARRRPWQSGVVAATVIGVGHLISSIAVVILFFATKTYFNLGEQHWIGFVAGGLLLALATWQLKNALAGGHHHDHHHDHNGSEWADRGLWGLGAFAFTLGFAHEEEFQIIAMCAGSGHCLWLMAAYALAVIVALVALTLALIAGLSHFRHRIEHAEPTLSFISAAILGLMGLGFIFGVFQR